MFKSPIGNLPAMEHRVTEMPGAHLWTEDSPVRFEIMEEGLKRGSGGPGGSRSIRIMGPTMLGLLKSLRSLSKNPSQPRTEAPPEWLNELETFLLGSGVSSVGYTRVPDLCPQVPGGGHPARARAARKRPDHLRQQRALLSLL
jgi:hypothetical protein